MLRFFCFSTLLAHMPVRIHIFKPLFLSVLTMLIVVSCARPKESVRNPNRERIILHKPESLQDQIHQVDTPMPFIPAKPDSVH